MEIVVRALFVFFFLWIVTRAVGRHSLGELSTFQLVLYVVMGDLIQQAVTQQDYSVTASVLAIATFALLTVGIGYLNLKVPRARRAISGTPIVIVKNGEPLLDAMRNERMTIDDLYDQARQQGIERIGDIRYGVLETDGQVSFFTYGGSGDNPGKREAAPAGG
jgi:uncharacterized membrane protein YcaP (DUF421 family)